MKTCKECQQAIRKEIFHCMPLQHVMDDFPFSKWFLYFIGPVNHPSSIRNIFILTATCYFTKWAYVIPLKNSWDEQVI